MEEAVINIKPYNIEWNANLIEIWEKSVIATHDFLEAHDIEYYKNIVINIDFTAFPVFCLEVNKEICGFIGVVESKIEMLFLAPNFIGLGLGQYLLNYAVTQLNANKVDVNEQNPKAIAFYEKHGFKKYNRLETDSEGKPFPILQMAL